MSISNILEFPKPDELLNFFNSIEFGYVQNLEYGRVETILRCIPSINGISYVPITLQQYNALSDPQRERECEIIFNNFSGTVLTDPAAVNGVQGKTFKFYKNDFSEEEIPNFLNVPSELKYPQNIIFTPRVFRIGKTSEKHRNYFTKQYEINESLKPHRIRSDIVAGFVVCPRSGGEAYARKWFIISEQFRRFILYYKHKLENYDVREDRDDRIKELLNLNAILDGSSKLIVNTYKRQMIPSPTTPEMGVRRLNYPYYHLRCESISKHYLHVFPCFIMIHFFPHLLETQTIKNIEEYSNMKHFVRVRTDWDIPEWLKYYLIQFSNFINPITWTIPHNNNFPIGSSSSIRIVTQTTGATTTDVATKLEAIKLEEH